MWDHLGAELVFHIVLYFVRGFKFVNLKSWFIILHQIIPYIYIYVSLSVLWLQFFIIFLSHLYLLFKHCLQGIIGLRCRMVTVFYLISTFFFKHFLQGIIGLGLRCRMVTFFYLRVLPSFFEHFLKGTMDLKHGLITSLQRHLTNSLQTACEHLTFFTSPPPRIRRGGTGGGYGVMYLLRTFDPPQNVSPCVLVLVPRPNIQIAVPLGFFPRGSKL